MDTTRFMKKIILQVKLYITYCEKTRSANTKTLMSNNNVGVSLQIMSFQGYLFALNRYLF